MPNPQHSGAAVADAYGPEGQFVSTQNEFTGRLFVNIKFRESERVVLRGAIAELGAELDSLNIIGRSGAIDSRTLFQKVEQVELNLARRDVWMLRRVEDEVYCATTVINCERQCSSGYVHGRGHIHGIDMCAVVANADV